MLRRLPTFIESLRHCHKPEHSSLIIECLQQLDLHIRATPVAVVLHSTASDLLQDT